MVSTHATNSEESALRSPSLAVLAAIVLRMSLLAVIHRNYDAHQLLFFPASHEVWRVAWSMAQGHGFSSPLAGMLGPTAWVAPGYPLLVALGLKLFRMDPYAATIFALTLNCIASACTCWPIYLVGKRIFNVNIGLASCWLWVFLPMAVLFPLEWLWDPSFSALLLTLLICLTLNLQKDSSTLHWVGYGLLWSASVLMNPALGILFPFLLVWLAAARSKSSLPWRRLVAIAVFVFILVLVPWTARNWIAFHHIVPVKSNFGLELWLGNNPTVKRSWNPAGHPVGESNQMQQLLLRGEITYMQAKQREALEFIKAKPVIFLRACFARFVDTWTGAEDFSSDRWVNALHLGRAYVVISTAFSVVAFVGLLLALRFCRSEAVPVALTVLVFPAIYYITHSALRYRHPIDPLLTVLAVHALACTFRRILAMGSSPSV